MEYQRDEIEQCIKTWKIDRAKFFEISKQSYQQIIQKIENTFVDKSKHWNTSIHWVNMGNYRPELKCIERIMKDWPSWMNELPYVIPSPDNPVYVLFEDTKDYKPKYWLYEACLNELMLVLNECIIGGDFYIVSKKFDWLISLNHHDVISYVGENLKIDSTAV